MFFAHVCVDIAHLRDFGETEARAIGVKGRAPHIPLGKNFTKPSQRLRLLRLGACPLISDIGGRRTRGLKFIVIACSNRRAGIGDPGAKILRICRDDRGGQFHCGFEIPASRRLRQILAQLRERACGEWTEILADILFKPCRVAFEFLAHKVWPRLRLAEP